MEQYTIYCTEEQTRKALELGAPLLKYTSIPNFVEVIEIAPYEYYEILTAEQMIGWLRSKGIKFNFSDTTNTWRITFNYVIIDCGKSERKELAAINAALDYLSRKKE